MVDFIVLHPWITIAGIIGFSGFIELVPLQVNPWSWLARTIGKSLNKDMVEKIEKIEIKLDDHIKTDMEESAEAKRSKILRFGSELMRGETFSQEHWRNTLQNIDKYETFCEQNSDFPNNEAVITINYIKEQYEVALKANKFLD